MSDYTPTTNFTTKDGLTAGDPEKIILGSDLDTEFSALQTAVNSKYDTADLASQAEAEAGTNSAKLMTPQRVEQALDALMSAGTGLSYSGRVYSLSHLGLQSLTDPNDDRIAFWDDTAGAFAWLDIGTNLSISGTTISAPTATLEAAISHDNLVGFVSNEHIDHSFVTLTAGNGLTGGGTIAASRSFAVGAGAGISVSADAVAVDISGLTSMTVAVGGTDGFLIDDGGTMKRMSFNEVALPSITASTARTFVASDIGRILFYTGTGGHSWTINSGIGQDNCYMIIVNSGSGTLTLAGGTATLNSANSLLDLPAGGVACMIRESSTVWFAGGALE